MGKITLDNPRRTVLYDITLKVGPVSILAISSTFGFLPSVFPFNIRGALIDGVPSCGETDFEQSYNGCIVILHRGIVSFAAKALRAIKAGAIALIVVQTLDIWPFMMSDSSGEISASNLSSHDGGLPIPVIMISKNDAEMVLKMLSASRKGSSSTSYSSLLEGCIHYGSPTKDCSICQEAFQDVCEILKLPCRHLYHSGCVIEWLQKNNTCPLCRLELPKEETPPQQQQRRRRDPNSSELSYYN
eukprot:CAMPEP_0170076266 /NCGR_PEP_ID=MMETSP0019_2-20121128/13264_1 /TAXON_ID=98059 /ORGANISM="Dinobryon sp., Strain UTEXLB2267" /LENGTH=243 /DNA_ID=CAMNT_0010287785 /DNA_START=276 /DNA_END=1007 /DNA_ORIENTATION=+